MVVTCFGSREPDSRGLTLNYSSLCASAVVLKLEPTIRIPWKVVKTQIARFHPEFLIQ